MQAVVPFNIFGCLPNELLGVICHHCESQQVLQALRGTCRSLCARVTSLAISWLNPKLALDVVKKNFRVYERLGYHNPAKYDRKIIFKALLKNPQEVFPCLPRDVQEDLDMKKACFFLARILGQTSICEGLSMEDEDQEALCERGRCARRPECAMPFSEFAQRIDANKALVRKLLDDSAVSWKSFLDLDSKLCGEAVLAEIVVYTQSSFLEIIHEKCVKAKVSKNRNLFYAAVQVNGLALQDADPILQRDFSLVLAAVRQKGEALFYAHPDLQDTFSVVFAAVSQNGCALQHASMRLRKNRIIALAAVRQTGWAFPFVHPDLQSDPEITQAANRSPREGTNETSKMDRLAADLMNMKI